MMHPNNQTSNNPSNVVTLQRLWLHILCDYTSVVIVFGLVSYNWLGWPNKFNQWVTFVIFHEQIKQGQSFRNKTQRLSPVKGPGDLVMVVVVITY